MTSKTRESTRNPMNRAQIERALTTSEVYQNGSKRGTRLCSQVFAVHQARGITAQTASIAWMSCSVFVPTGASLCDAGAEFRFWLRVVWQTPQPSTYLSIFTADVNPWSSPAGGTSPFSHHVFSASRNEIALHSSLAMQRLRQSSISATTSFLRSEPPRLVLYSSTDTRAL